MRVVFFASVVLVAAAMGACAGGGKFQDGFGGFTPGGSTNGGGGGKPAAACPINCAALQTGNPCLVSVCDTGQVEGSIGHCIVAAAPDETACASCLSDGGACWCHGGSCVPAAPGMDAGSDAPTD
jgi:hypothetical protein